MIRLNLAAAPEWFDLGYGVRVQARPITSAVIAAARHAQGIEALPETATTDMKMEALAKSVAVHSIIAWEGVGDEGGAAVEPTPETIAALMDVFQISRAFVETCLRGVFLLDAEKKD